MTDPELLRSLRGQQYLVLRPVVDVAKFYDGEQRSLRGRLQTPLPHPHTGHVTLRGFFEPERVQPLRDALAGWAQLQAPIDLRVAAVDGFPTPFQIVIARAERSPSLVSAFATLTEMLGTSDFRRIGEFPLDEWVFHLSLLYASALPEHEWLALHAQSRRDLASAPAEVITSAEYVWYDDDGEHIEVLSLGTDRY